ncbi:hypothetical protein ACTFIU_000333 [Dictyostelium citrinum]
MNINIIDFLTNIFKENYGNNNNNEINIEQNQSLVSSLFLLIPNLSKLQLLLDLEIYLKNSTISTDNRFLVFLLSIIYNIIKYNYNNNKNINSNNSDNNNNNTNEEVENKTISIIKFYLNKFIIQNEDSGNNNNDKKNNNSNNIDENEIKNITIIISNIQNLIFNKEIYSTCCQLINGVSNSNNNSNKYGFFIVNNILNNEALSTSIVEKMSIEFYPTLIPVIIENLENSSIINQYTKQQSLLILPKILLDKNNVSIIENNQRLKSLYQTNWLKSLWNAIVKQKDINERLKLCFFFHQCYFDCLLFNLKKSSKQQQKQQQVEEQQLEPIFNIIEKVEYWNILFESLIDKDSLPRKQAVHLLKNTVSLPSMLWKDQLPKNWEQKQWNLFFSLYECFDETKSHLFIPVWVQIHNLSVNVKDDNFTQFSKPTSIYFWIRILYLRGFNHININIKKRVILDALADVSIVPYLNGYGIDFSEFQLPLLKALDAYELSNPYELERNKELGERLSTYFSHCVKSTNDLEQVLQFTSKSIQEIKTIILFISTLSPLVSKLKLTPTTTLFEQLRSILICHPIQNDNNELYQQVCNFIQSLIISTTQENLSFSQISKILSLLPNEMTSTQDFKNWVNSTNNNWFINNLINSTNNFFKEETNNNNNSYNIDSYQIEKENLQGLSRILSICLDNEISDFIETTILPLSNLSSLLESNKKKTSLLLFINCILEELSQQQLLNCNIIEKLLPFKEILVSLVKEYIVLNNQTTTTTTTTTATTIMSKEDSEKIIDQFKTMESIIRIIKKFNNTNQILFNEMQRLIVETKSLDLKGITVALFVWIQSRQYNGEGCTIEEQEILIKKLLELEPRYKFDSTISFLLPKFIQYKWTCIHSILYSNSSSTSFKYDQEKTFDLAISALDNATGSVLIPIFECLSIVISTNKDGSNLITSNEEYMNQLFKQSYLAFSDSNRKPNNLCVAFTNLLFNSVLFENPVTIPLIKEYLKQTLGDWGESARISCGLLSHCCAIWSKKTNTLPIFLNEIMDLCLLTSEDQLILEDDYENSNEEKNNNIESKQLFNNHGYIIRWFVSQLESKECKPFVETLLLELMQLNFKGELSKREYSQQSRLNKIKCKLWRTLCSLTHIVSFSESNDLYEKVSDLMWKTLELKNHGNVRYLIQLFIVNVLIKSPNIQVTNQQLINRMESAINADYQISASLIIISSTFLYYLLNNYQDNYQDCVINLFKTILPWSTDFHHAVRTTSQLAIYSIINKKFKILQQFNDNQFILSLYNYLDTHKIQKRLREKQTLFIQNDDPLKKTLADNIFTTSSSAIDSNNNDADDDMDENEKQKQQQQEDDDYSNLSVLDDSVIPMSLLDISKRLIKDFQVSFQNNQIQQPIVPTSALSKAEDQPTTITSENSNTPSSSSPSTEEDILDFQRRITPWQWVNKLEEHHQISSGSGNSSNSKNSKKSRQSIIVCGTLIENTPNIAGLIRTCEIFNVEEVAIPNNKLLSDPQFQRVSVSAEKWVPTIEVTKPNLLDYLKLKKKQGYSILGVEQTSQSKRLSSFQFPQKCLLLLGQEQNGIPAEYLSIIDYAVEIEQLGQIRSLNVHVSGSIVIWEYTQQQILKQQQ